MDETLPYVATGGSLPVIRYFFDHIFMQWVVWIDDEYGTLVSITCETMEQARVIAECLIKRPIHFFKY